jgi:hypothetical protein
MFISQYLNATGEAFSPHKRTSSTSKQEVSKLYFHFVGHFPSWIRIRILNLNLLT